MERLLGPADLMHNKWFDGSTRYPVSLDSDKSNDKHLRWASQ